MADLEKLVLTIEARTAQFEKALKQVESNTASFANAGERNIKRFGRQIDGIESQMGRFASKTGGFLKAGLAGLVAGLTSELSGGFNRIFEDLDNIGKTADKVGLTTTALQELRYAGELTGVQTGALDVAMQRFSRRLAEAADGSGALYKVLKANGVAIRDSEGAIRPLIDILNDYASLIQAAPSDQEKLRLAFVAFDSEGAALVNTMRDGSAGLDSMRQEAQRLGVVIGEDLVRDAERINDEFTRLSKTIATNFKAAVVSIANEAGYLFDLLNSAESRSLSTINQQIAEKQSTIDRYGREREGSLYRSIVGQSDGKGIERVKRDMEDLIALRNQLQTQRTPPTPPITAEFEGFGADASSSSKRGGRSGRISEEARAREAAAKAAEAQAEKVLDVVRSLEFEEQQLGRTKDEQELYNVLARAGVTLESEQGQAIRDAVVALQAKRAAILAAEEAQKRLEEQTRGLQDAFEFLGSGALDLFDSIIDGSGDAGDAIKRLALQIANAAAQAALFGQGPLAGLFGSLGGGGGIFGSLASIFASSFFGGGGDPWAGMRANGGQVMPGSAYLVGERGPETFIPTHAGRIEPNRTVGANDNGSGAGSVVVHMTVQTPDIASFRQSQGQVATDLARAVSRGRRNM